MLALLELRFANFYSCRPPKILVTSLSRREIGLRRFRENGEGNTQFASMINGVFASSGRKRAQQASQFAIIIDLLIDGLRRVIVDRTIDQ